VQAIKSRVLLVTISLLLVINCNAQVQPVAWWSFDNVSDTSVTDVQTQISDTISGNHRTVNGVSGSALVFDGYTSAIIRDADHAPKLQEAFTIDVWLAVAAYPWNDVPIISHSDEKLRGYALEMGPRGELRFEVVVNGRMIAARSNDHAVPPHTWAHVAARYAGNDGLSIFVDGKLVASGAMPVLTDSFGRVPSAKLQPATDQDLIIGAVRQPRRPSSYHRFKGNQPSWYSFDGFIDELRIFDVALSDAIINQTSASTRPPPAEFAPRIMPSGPPGPGRFGAYLTNLSYYPEWDGLWRTGPHADLIVRFDRSPARVVFWRGTQYSPAWVTGNGLWMADQSVEGYDDDYTWEHMNDKQNRYSHVRIIEQHDARVVVHWRYAPVSVKNELMNIDERLGNGAWVDEYYYFYPDVTGVRKVTWKRDTLGKPVQFQESIPLAHPGQTQGDVVENVYATVANLAGEMQHLAYVEDPGESQKTFPDDLTIQMHHLRAPQKPFIIFESGNQMMYLRDLNERSLSRPGSSSHWPVGQILSDGRTSQAADRASSFLGFPISEPVQHQDEDGRDYVNSLYGMTNQPFEELVPLARSWSNPPPMNVEGRGFDSLGYDRSERIYRLRRRSGVSSTRLSFDATSQSPVRNLALLIENWGTAPPQVRLDDQELERGDTFRFGYRHTLEGSDLIIWIDVQAEKRVSLLIKSDQ
jgi:hypothetical protein